MNNLNLRDYFKIGIFYSLIKYLIMGIGVIKSFYIADALGATLLGAYAVIMLIVEYLNYSNLGIFAAMNRDVAINLEDDLKKNKVKELLDVSLSFAFFPILFLSLLFFILDYYEAFFLPEEFFKNTLMILGLVAIYQYKIFLLRYLRLYGRYFVLAFIELAAQFINLIGVLLFIELYSINAVLWAVLISNIFFVICGFFFLKSFTFKINFQLIRYMISVGLPLSIYSIVLLVLSSADRIVITESFSNRTSLGLYQFGVMASQGLFIAFSSITFLFYPRWIKFLYEKNEKIESFKLMTKQNEIVEILLGFLSVFGIMFIPLFIDYFLPQYSASILVAQLLLLAYMLNGMTFITSTFLISNNYQIKLVPIIALTIFLAFSLNYYFIDLGYGLYGIAFSTILSFGIYSFLVFYFASKHSNSLNLKNIYRTFRRMFFFIPISVFILYENYNLLVILFVFAIIYLPLTLKLISKFLKKSFEN